MNDQTTSSKNRRSSGPWLGRSLVQPAVIGLFHRYGVLSGAKLSTLLGVGRSSAHLILDRLHRDQAIYIEGKKPGEPLPPGRPTTDYKLNGRRGAFLGLALREQDIQWMLVSFSGQILESGAVSASVALGSVDDFLQWLGSAFGPGSTMAAKHPPVIAVTVGLDARMSEDTPGVVESTSVFTEKNVTLVDLIRARFRGAAVSIAPMASLAAVSESLRSFSEPSPTLFILADPTFGVEAGYAIAGRRIVGIHRAAGRIESISRRRAECLSELSGTAAMTLEGLDWLALCRRAESGDTPARDLRAAVSRELAQVISALTSTLDVALVVLESRDETLAEFLTADVERHLSATSKNGDRPISVELSPHRSSTVVRGAALMPIASAISRAIDFEFGSHQPDHCDLLPPVIVDVPPE